MTGGPGTHADGCLRVFLQTFKFMVNCGNVNGGHAHAPTSTVIETYKTEHVKCVAP